MRKIGKSEAVRLMVAEKMSAMHPGEKMAILSLKNGPTIITRNQDQIEDKTK